MPWVLRGMPAIAGVFENENAAIIQRHLGGLPGLWDATARDTLRR